MRYIHQIFAPTLGERWENHRVLSEFEGAIARLEIDEAEREKLLKFVQFQLVGERSRRSLTPDWKVLKEFKGRADTFQRGADQALDALAEQILPVAETAGITFDAVLTTTATGNMMPGLSYRAAQRLGGRVRPDSLMVDLGNVGCTGSSKLLNLARSLDDSLKNILIVAVEVPSTLVDVSASHFDLWQGNCTFGDGAAALWVSNDPDQGPGALALEDVQYRQRADAGLNLIRWEYRDYYTFALADQTTFDRDVREFVTHALSETEAGWKDEPRWAIHPAGILLLMKISRKLGIPGEAIQPSVRHYREYSNMSSAGVMHILKEQAEETPIGGAINLLTMGAGFNVIYGRVRRVR